MLSDENDEMNFDIKGFKQGELFFSNSVEVLFEHLKLNLFSEDTHPFSQRVLISPSSAMQQWIQMQLATSLSIAGGIMPTFLNKAIEILTDRLFEASHTQFFPSQLELFLRIEHEIDQTYTSQDKIWEPLCKYLEGKQHRKTALASHLAKQFIRYGIFANRAAHDWETNPSNWQEALWAKIFNDWDYPLRNLLSLKPKQTMPADLSVHLFACSHLSPLHFHFFCTVSHYVPVYFYHLSTCQEFWSGLDESTPPLLENLGKVGRAMARQIEESDLLTEESYLEFGGKTQLKQLQRGLLHIFT